MRGWVRYFYVFSYDLATSIINVYVCVCVRERLQVVERNCVLVREDTMILYSAAPVVNLFLVGEGLGQRPYSLPGVLKSEAKYLRIARRAKPCRCLMLTALDCDGCLQFIIL